ncbi:uncharacterized protein RB166_001036 [Leptodactylus fuscus]
MSEDIPCKDCTIHYLSTSALVILIWLAAAVAFWYLKMRKTDGNKQNSNPAHEMIQVTEGNQDSNVIYREVVFNNHNKKPREEKSEETTYAEIKKSLQEDDGLVYTEVTHKTKAKNLPQNTSPETTYAEVKLMPRPEDCSKDLYACVNKQKNNTKT